MHVQAVHIVHDRYPTRDRHPYDLQILQATRQLELTSPVTCFIGENGTGKSTLLRALCRRCGVHIWQRPEDTRLEANPYEETFQHMLDVDWTTGPVPGSFFGSEVFRDFTHLLEECVNLRVIRGEDLGAKDPSELWCADPDVARFKATLRQAVRS